MGNANAVVLGLIAWWAFFYCIGLFIRFWLGKYRKD